MDKTSRFQLYCFDKYMAVDLTGYFWKFHYDCIFLQTWSKKALSGVSSDHAFANEMSFESGSLSLGRELILIRAGRAAASPTNNASCLGSEDSAEVMFDRLSGKNRDTCC